MNNILFDQYMERLKNNPDFMRHFNNQKSDLEASVKSYFETKASYEDWLEWYHTIDKKQYPGYSFTVDNVVFRWDNENQKVKILLVKRKQHPYINKWALPGGFVEANESSIEAVARETKEETSLEISKEHIQQLATFDKPDRDPRGRVITVAHIVYLPETYNHIVKGGDDTSKAEWFDLSYVLNNMMDNMAFDHKLIVETAIERVRNQLDYSPNILRILPEKFLVSQMKTLYEEFSERYKDLSSRNFYIVHQKFVEETGEIFKLERGRPGKLYKIK